MKANKLICIISALFFSSMLFSTLFARSIHDSRLPHVKVFEIKKQDFICEFTDDEGNSYQIKRRAIGIPKKYAGDKIFVVGEMYKYGEKRKCAVQAEIIFLDDYYSDEFYAVSYGLSSGDKIIIDTSGISEGCEIIVIE